MMDCPTHCEVCKAAFDGDAREVGGQWLCYPCALEAECRELRAANARLWALVPKHGAEVCPAGTLAALREALAFVDGACTTGRMVPCWANAARAILEAAKK